MSDARTVVVTGSTDGIGKETALSLARKGWRVIVHGRSPAKVDAAVAAIRHALGEQRGELAGWACDLSSLAEVRARARELLALAPRLDVFLHNAGVYARERQITPEGFELTLAVSHLAPFLLVQQLLPSLAAAAPARVVMVSSQVHSGGHLRLDDLNLSRGFTGYAAYAQAKLCNVLFANGLAARFAPQQLTANSLHPGVVGTKLLTQGFGMRGGPDSLAEGAETSVYLAASPEVANVTGRYFSRSRETRMSDEARDETLREALWKKSEELTGAHYA